MPSIETFCLHTLREIDADVLQEITADGHVFASPGWFSFIESLDLNEVTQGDVKLRFAVTFENGVPVAVLPVMRARGSGIYFLYSLRRFFFEHWIEEAVRLHPDRREKYARMFSVVTGLRRAFEWTAAPLDASLIVGSPLSFRCQPAVSPSAQSTRKQIYANLISFLKQKSRTEKLPLWFLGVEGEPAKNPWNRALSHGECEPVFLFHDNFVRLDRFESFDGYLHSFRRTTRRAFERDLKRTQAAGIEYRFVERFSALADQFSSLYRETYSKHGNSFFKHGPDYWRSLESKLEENVECVVAARGDDLIGFSALLASRRRGEMWTYRIGRSTPLAGGDPPYYFGLSFYAPIRRAIEFGYRRIWLGPAGYEAKRVRGAEQLPIYSYFWFPRKWDRMTLQRYLKLFGKISREQLDASLVDHSGSHLAVPETTSTSSIDRKP